MAKISIYIEGYVATGQKAPASLLAEIEAKDFDSAVKNLAKTGAHKIDLDRFGKGRHAIWACELFDSYEEARKSFG